jgi:hypothetical protein
MDERNPMSDRTASPLERALLEEARTYRIPSEMRGRTLAALGVASHAGIAGGVLAWLASRSLTTKVILALSTVTLLAAIPLAYLLVGGRVAAPRSGAVNPLVPPPAAPPALAPMVVSPSPASVPSAAVKPLSMSASANAANANTAVALRVELAALDAVRSALANDDASGALSLVATYFRTFPRGRLHPEAEVLRIDALAKAGQINAARRQAHEFIKRHPNSVLTPRIRSYAGY